MGHSDARREPRPATTPASLRTHWNRAFALLTLAVLVSGVAGIVGSQLLVHMFRDSAVAVEHEASTSVALQADVIAHAIIYSTADSLEQVGPLGTLQTRVEAEFQQSIDTQRDPAAKELMRQAFGEWSSMIAGVGPGLESTTTERGLAVSTKDPAVLTLIDQAGTANRTAVRADLADAAALNRIVLAAIALVEVVAVLLTVRLARRLSAEVLRPVGILQDSADHLARGELDHRVEVDRSDELGQLALSFNAMADAIADSQQLLILEAGTDPLTGLPNRTAFHARLAASLLDQSGDGTDAVLFIDLDDFKDVNDGLGHATGDDLLRVASQRLRAAVRPHDMVARLGGDEFAVLLQGLHEPQMAIDTANRIVTVISAPVAIRDTTSTIGASVGLAFRQRASTPDTLMRQADVAMYTAKRKGKNRVERFDAEMDTRAVARHSLIADLSTAAAKGELFLRYQPIVDLNTGALVGVESLVRWQHPRLGLLEPAAFIPLAEESGSIVGIGEWVLEKAARQLHTWRTRFQCDQLYVSVNVSVRQVDRPGFGDEVMAQLGNAGLDPTNLMLEITESVLADPAGDSSSTLAELRQQGVRVALDDFGTGYCSIGYLRQLPVDLIKIDRSFVSGAELDGPAGSLLEAIVSMAEHLGLGVIPEGIETVGEMDRLRAMGCATGQGYLLSRPVAAEVIDMFLATGMPLPSPELYRSGCDLQSRAARAVTPSPVSSASADFRPVIASTNETIGPEISGP
jgi:diguanylate cyclase (GGDEF)-like protein